MSRALVLVKWRVAGRIWREPSVWVHRPFLPADSWDRDRMDVVARSLDGSSARRRARTRRPSLCRFIETSGLDSERSWR